jgi:hypothetical protein
MPSMNDVAQEAQTMARKMRGTVTLTTGEARGRQPRCLAFAEYVEHGGVS